jgi:hypothetical protein
MNRQKTLKCEIYRDIPGYEGYYQASNKGNVRSVRTGRILAQTKNNGGYPMVSISVNCKHEMKTVHRLVAQAFIENPLNHRDVNHIDGDKTNNDSDNLEWVEHSDNIRHSYSELKQRRNDVAVKCIETGMIYRSIKEASEKIGISRGAIQHAIDGLTRRAGGYQWTRL